MERDWGWNDDDKVGEWNYVPTFGTSIYLTPSHHKALGLPQHATVYMIHTYPGQTLYRE